jgi:uncharacterized membrane protein
MKKIFYFLFKDFTTRTKPLKGRIVIIDLIRVFGILTMVHFHFSYDLALFGMAKFNWGSKFWYLYPRVIASMFLLTSGMSFELIRQKNSGKKSIATRAFQIAIYALVISLSTYLLYPAQWIYFGTLHCIASCLLISLILLRNNFLLIGIFILINILFFSNFITYRDMLGLSPIKSLDYIPLYPWYLVFLLGVMISRFSQINTYRWQGEDGIFRKMISFLSQKTLAIYVVHQPILFALLFLAQKVAKFS